jgi:uncharacterized membrane protein
MAVVHLCYYYPKLPDKVASHFGTSDLPDSWMSKNTLMFLFLGLYVFISGLMFSIPYTINKIPISLVNFPNKRYWLAPERYHKVKPEFGKWFNIFAIALLIFFIFTTHLVIKANLSAPVVFDGRSMIVGLVLFTVFVLIWLIGFYRRFSKKEES